MRMGRLAGDNFTDSEVRYFVLMRKGVSVVNSCRLLVDCSFHSSSRACFRVE